MKKKESSKALQNPSNQSKKNNSPALEPLTIKMEKATPPDQPKPPKKNKNNNKKKINLKKHKQVQAKSLNLLKKKKKKLNPLN